MKTTVLRQERMVVCLVQTLNNGAIQVELKIAYPVRDDAVTSWIGTGPTHKDAFNEAVGKYLKCLNS